MKYKVVCIKYYVLCRGGGILFKINILSRRAFSTPLEMTLAVSFRAELRKEGRLTSNFLSKL